MRRHAMQSATVQTFYVLPSAGRPQRRQVSLDQWRLDPGENLARMSGDFSVAREALEFSTTFRKAERRCLAADHRFDSRLPNPRAQAMLPASLSEAMRGDVIIEMTRHIWPTNWVSASVSDMEDVADNLDLDQVAIKHEWRQCGGCYVATPNAKGLSIVMATLLLAAPDP
jgi:hypothetical protein